MSLTMRTFAFVFFVCIGMGFAVPTYAASYFDVGDEKVFLEPSDDEAVVYFVRPATFFGAAIRLWAFVDETPIGVTRGKSYTVGKVAPGRHIFWAKAENISALELEVEAGKTYYLKQKVKMGAIKARVVLEVMTEEEWEKAVKKCKYSKLNEAGEIRAAEIAADGFEKSKSVATKEGEK